MWGSEFYPKENFNDRKTALGIPEILYNVIYSRPRVARTAAVSRQVPKELKKTGERGIVGERCSSFHYTPLPYHADS